MFEVQIDVLKNLPISVYIYIGKGELQAGVEHTRSAYGTASNEDKLTADVMGFVNNFIMYIQDPTDIRTVLHETYHLTQNVVGMVLDVTDDIEDATEYIELCADVFDEACFKILSKIYTIEVKHDM
jgi:hypothetical protein